MTPTTHAHPTTNTDGEKLGLAINKTTSMPPPDAGYPAWQSAPLRTYRSARDDEQNKARSAPANENPAPTPAPAPPPPPPPPCPTPPTSFSRSWRGKLAYAALILLGVGLVVAAFVPVSAAADDAIPQWLNQNRRPQAHISPSSNTLAHRDHTTPPHHRHSSSQSSRTRSWTIKPLAMAGSPLQSLLVHSLPKRQQLQLSFPRR